MITNKGFGAKGARTHKQKQQGQESLEVPTQEVLLFALLALETRLLPQVDKGGKTADLGGDPNTAVFLPLFSALDISPSCGPRLEL